jgi:hypothetical protein
MNVEKVWRYFLIPAWALLLIAWVWLILRWTGA